MLTLQRTVTNIHHNQPLVCRNQLHHEDLGIFFSSFQQMLKRSKGRKVKILKLDDGMENLYMFAIHVWENLDFQIWSLYAYSRGDHSSFTR